MRLSTSCARARLGKGLWLSLESQGWTTGRGETSDGRPVAQHLDPRTRGPIAVYPERFNHELTRILDRVYGVQLVDGVDRAVRPITEDLSRQRRQRGVEALERALEDLRQLRARSQGAAALKDELDYLSTQIAELKALGDEISRLRVQLGDLPAEAIGEGDAIVQGPQVA